MCVCSQENRALFLTGNFPLSLLAPAFACVLISSPSSTLYPVMIFSLSFISLSLFLTLSLSRARSLTYFPKAAQACVTTVLSATVIWHYTHTHTHMHNACTHIFTATHTGKRLYHVWGVYRPVSWVLSTNNYRPFTDSNSFDWAKLIYITLELII